MAPLSNATDPRFPIGKFQFDPAVSPEVRQSAIAVIRATPAAMRAAVAGLNAARLDTPYRDGGWTVRQLVHHVPESHMHAYIRTKLALTEDNPTIKPYDEAAWATLADVPRAPIEASLTLLDALHLRWATLLDTLAPEDWGRALVHPERGRMTLDDIVQMYAWHGRHHVAHITALRARQGW